LVLRFQAIRKCDQKIAEFKAEKHSQDQNPNHHRKLLPRNREQKRGLAFKQYRKLGRKMKDVVLSVCEAVNESMKLLPDYRYALALLGISNPPHAMLKTAASKSMSTNSKRFEISFGKRGKKFDRSPVVVFRKRPALTMHQHAPCMVGCILNSNGAQ
jgi:hypothetical protein